MRQLLNIGLDYNGIVGNSDALRSKLAKKMFRVEIPAHNFKKEYILQNAILTLEQYNFINEETFNKVNTIHFVENAGRYIPLWLHYGHYLKVITSCYGLAFENARKSLANAGFSEIPIVTTETAISKLDQCRGLHVYVDNDLRKLVPLVGTVPYLFLYSPQKKERITTPTGIVRVSSWAELYDKVWYDVRI